MYNGNIFAEVILDSLHPYNNTRITTIRGICHRFVLAELNTHRVFSRNSASSRAKSLSITIRQVETNPAYPVIWTAEQKGMSGNPDTLTSEQIASAQQVWWEAARDATEHARELQAIGIHKSLANRLMEPYMWHEVLITSTKWNNFFRQRVSSLAQPEMRAFAEEIKDAYDASIPQQLKRGQWHLPFVTSFSNHDYDEQYLNDQAYLRGIDENEFKCMVSSARSARVSYKSLDGAIDLPVDLTLFQRLEHPPKDDSDNIIIHLSPMEHQAKDSSIKELLLGSGGNFGRGWTQYRQLIERRNNYVTTD